MHTSGLIMSADCEECVGLQFLIIINVAVVC